MIEKIKDFFSEKLHFFILGLLSGVAAVLFRKIVHDNRKRAEGDRVEDRPADEFSRDAERVVEESRIAAESVHDIIKRVREREQGTQGES